MHLFCASRETIDILYILGTDACVLSLCIKGDNLMASVSLRLLHLFFASRETIRDCCICSLHQGRQFDTEIGWGGDYVVSLLCQEERTL